MFAVLRIFVVLCIIILLGCRNAEAQATDQAATGKQASPVASPDHRASGAILAIRHDPERGITAIAVSTSALPPCSRINIFRSVSPITEDNLLFCPRVASLTKDNAGCSIVSSDNPLEVDWCNVPNCRATDLQEWKRRGAVAAFCGMVGKNEESYRQRLQAGFNGVAVDEIGSYDAGTPKPTQV